VYKLNTLYSLGIDWYRRGMTRRKSNKEAAGKWEGNFSPDHCASKRVQEPVTQLFQNDAGIFGESVVITATIPLKCGWPHYTLIGAVANFCRGRLGRLKRSTLNPPFNPPANRKRQTLHILKQCNFGSKISSTRLCGNEQKPD